MSNEDKYGLGRFVLDLAIVGVCALVKLAISADATAESGDQDAPEGSRGPDQLVSLDELSVAQIAKLPAGHLAPMPDQQNLALYCLDYLVECDGCDHQYYAGPANTHLIIYTLEPQYTHRQHTCPGGHGGITRALGMNNLMMFVQAGCRIIVRADRAEDGIRRLFTREDGAEYGVDDATEVDRTIHAMGLEFDPLPHDEGDPLLARAREPTE